MIKLTILFLLLTTVRVSLGALLPPPLMPKLPLFKRGPVLAPNGTELPPLDTWYYFQQLIDHNNPDQGTFTQRYYFSYEFYKPGGPIMLITPGEQNADGYDRHLGNASIFGQIAIQESAAMIMLEHRFYGESNPYPDLSTDSLKAHTLQQAINDLEYFAKNVALPMPEGNNVGPDKAPWIMAGGSYSAALTVWAMQNKPGLFWAGYASSAVVQTMTDFWQYFQPITEFMDRNCSSDVQSVFIHVDQTLASGNQSTISELKDTFGLGILGDDDFAAALTWVLTSWQSLQPSSGPNTIFHRFCDALEVKDGVVAPSTGFGLDHALSAWGTHFQSMHDTWCEGLTIPQCWEMDSTTSLLSDVTVGNTDRSWNWIVCNEVGWIQAGPPSSAKIPIIASRTIRPDSDDSYFHRVCRKIFPGAFDSNLQPFSHVDRTNVLYEGWSVQVPRLFLANGKRDTWRETTLSAKGSQVKSSPDMPIMMSDAFHCSDISSVNGVYDPSVKAVQQAALGKMSEWIGEWRRGRR